MSVSDFLGIAFLVLPLLVPLGGALYRALLEKLPSNQQAIVDSVVHMVVAGVEQVGQGFSSAGKKEMALSKLSSILKSKGIKLSPSEADMAIEEAVFLMNRAFHPAAALSSGPDTVGFSAPAVVPAPAATSDNPNLWFQPVPSTSYPVTHRI
jgi:Bacteriophage holin of superfamily 6 (Holin_LLH)